MAQSWHLRGYKVCMWQKPSNGSDLSNGLPRLSASWISCSKDAKSSSWMLQPVMHGVATVAQAAMAVL